MEGYGNEVSSESWTPGSHYPTQATNNKNVLVSNVVKFKENQSMITYSNKNQF